MIYDDLIKYYKTQKAIGAALGMKQCNISKWRTAGAIPIAYQCQYEVITEGRITACRETLEKIKNAQK